MSYFVVDVESDGPIPIKYSMVCFGAVAVHPSLSTNFPTFYGKTRPISDEYQKEALSISGFGRNQHLLFDDPKIVMQQFADWIDQNNQGGKPVFITDNLAYDWQWINFYFHYFLGRNPFGYSGRRIGDLFCGMKHDCRASWKHLRKTIHDHNPVNDAKGNAEALINLNHMGLKLF